jgi:DNA-binding NtrC family response regulator
MAAEILGISRYALIRRMRKYKIDIKRNEAER